MKPFNWRDWGITARLVLITVLPVGLLFVSVVFYSYYSRHGEVQQELDERGRLIASSIAESSEYGVISGNLSYIERTIRGLLETDKTIFRIEVTNGKKTVVSITSDTRYDSNTSVFEAPIRRELVDVNSFGDNDRPHLSASVDSSGTRSGDTIGYVRVTMSPSPMLAKQQQRIVVNAAIAGTVLLLSVALGLYLAFGLTRPLAATIAAVRRIRGGDYAIEMGVTAGGEIGDLQSSIKEMAGSLDEFRRDLESKVAARTHDLEAARDDAIKSNAEKRRLIQKVNSAVEEERRNIAVEIHDHLNAVLIVVRLEAQRILDLAESDSTSRAANEIKTRALSVIKLTLDLYEEARSIVRRLRPEVIDTLGLRDAVEEMVRHYDTLQSQCRLEFQAEGSMSSLNSELAITAYRLIQEALSNVIKHSAATKAKVHLHLLEDEKLLRITVSDNGKGFDAGTIEPGIGLIGMRERVDGLGGQLEIHTAINAGTVIDIALSVDEDHL